MTIILDRVEMAVHTTTSVELIYLTNPKGFEGRSHLPGQFERAREAGFCRPPDERHVRTATRSGSEQEMLKVGKLIEAT